MILKLRKTHLLLWSSLTMILIPLFVVSLLKIPANPEDPFKRKVLPPLANEVRLSEGDCCKLIIRSDGNDRYQLEVTIKNSLPVPSAFIYKINDGQKTLVGKIGSKGIYRFPLPDYDPESTIRIQFFDEIKKDVIDEFEL